MSTPIKRRDFVKTTAAISALAAVPGAVSAAYSPIPKKKFPSDKLNIAIIGLRMGRSNMKNILKTDENIVALCDVDKDVLDKNMELFKKDYPKLIEPYAFTDFRKMFDSIANEIDAVVIATPDHTHAYITLTAMQLGKHVYTQKPLTHHVYESRLLTKAADYYGVATQMGNQGASGEGTQLICEAIWNGDIGDITKVDSWTNRPIWPQCLNRPTEKVAKPKDLNWDLWLGPAPTRDYNPAYHPFNWRGWWDFGTGALGDMACHILDVVVRSLKLEYPTHIQSSSSRWNIESGPESEKITFHFPERTGMSNVNFPKVDVSWYDGGMMPDRPSELADRKLIGNWGGGVVFHGTKGKIVTGCYAQDTVFLPYDKFEDYQPPKSVRRVDGSHEADWIRACKEDKASRVKAKSHFGIAGPLNEMVTMGTVAPRLQSLNRTLEWDGENMKFTNIADNERMKVPLRYDLDTSGIYPRYKPEEKIVNALEFAQSLVRRKPREGWDLDFKI